MRTNRLIRTLFVALLAFALVGVTASAQKGEWAGIRYDDRFFTVGDHFYAPNESTVTAGKPVRFHLVNASPDHLHNFLLLAEDGTLVGGRTEVIHPDRRVTVEWTPVETGTYLISCAVCPVEEGRLATVHVV